MTLALAIITDALRESNLIPVGVVPSEPEQAEGLQRLRSLIASVYGHDIGHPLTDWMVGSDGYADKPQGWGPSDWAYPRANVRLVLNVIGPETVYLPQNPADGARIAITDRKGNLDTFPLTINGNGRKIEGAATVQIAEAGVEREWFYRADLGDWEQVNNLTDVNSEMPFPLEFDDYFIIKLAIRMNPRYGRSLTPESKDRLDDIKGQLQARYRQKRNVGVDPGVLGRTTGYLDPYNPGFGQ